MRSEKLIPLQAIAVPPPKPDQVYELAVFGETFRFAGLKRLLGAADHSKAGDRGAGLAASSEVEREAARSLLSALTLQHLHDRPLTNAEGRIDAVMRVNYAIDRDVFATISHWTVGQLKDRLLVAGEDEIKKIGGALTGVMVAAVAKLMDTHELVLVAQKISRPTKARTHLGNPGTLSSRLQPNHPTDDLRGLTLLLYTGLSLGAGDALWGVNPAVDTVESVAVVLHHLDKVRRQTGAPTQICVLSHIKTQLACLERGAPVEIIFQSLGGTEDTNLTEFDISVELLDTAHQAMLDRGPLRGEARQFMYFETGQGSEFTYGKHNGMDMTTNEALCYGLARRYDPFMVNNVTGFIGPETHLDNFEMIISNLQDHFMGKLLGLPMGMAPCYTLHSKITLEGQQMATQLLTAAGANYYMDVHLNTDRMLAYFDTSAHDDQTLREVYRKKPTPEYLVWGLQQGIFREGPDGEVLRGPHWGDVRRFCESALEYEELKKATPALYGFENAGARPSDKVSRELRLHQAAAREAIYRELDTEGMSRLGEFRVLGTLARNKADHLGSPSLGAALDSAAMGSLAEENNDIQIVASDGLSAEAVHANLPDLFPVLRDGFQRKALKMGAPILAPYGRVKLAEAIARVVKAKLTVMLIGERPGGDAQAARSLSAYLVYRVSDPQVRESATRFSGNAQVEFEYSVISNICPQGIPAAEAGSLIIEKCLTILQRQAAGNRLERLLAR